MKVFFDILIFSVADILHFISIHIIIIVVVVVVIVLILGIFNINNVVVVFSTL